MRTNAVNLTKEEAIRVVGYDLFGRKATDFVSDGLEIQFNDGEGTIWQLDTDPHFDEDGNLTRWERHRGESPECCWTEWKEEMII